MRLLCSNGLNKPQTNQQQQKNLPKKAAAVVEKIPRGKKGKLKKMKEKYVDQDEEERKVKLKLLGVLFLFVSLCFSLSCFLVLSVLFN